MQSDVTNVQCLINKSHNTRDFSTGSTIEGIAVDYINQFLFYTCTFDKAIVVVSLKNKDIHKTIVNESLGKPKDIIAHPERG
jgi:hypothetical protein